MTAKTLYRMYGKDDVLIYVGMSWHPRSRFKAHAQDSFWFVDVTTITLTRFGTEEECKQAEATAIQEERPIYNAKRTPPLSPRGRRLPRLPQDNDFYLIVGKVIKQAHGKVVGGILEVASPYGPLEFTTWFKTHKEAEAHIKGKTANA